jgi:hypothetical protein
MPVTIQYRTLYVFVCCFKAQRLEYARLILPMVLSGCETLFLRLRVFEDRVLKRIL